MAQWVVLELSSRADGEMPDLVRASIRHYISRDAEVFLPASTTKVGDDLVVKWLVEGYAFIRKDYPEERFFKLIDTKYVQGPVYAGGKLATVGDQDIEKFRAQVRAAEDQGICVGDTVEVTSGAYRNLKAKVLAELPDQEMVQVYVRLRSKESLVTLPRSFLRLHEKMSTTHFIERGGPILTWLRKALPLVQWQGRPDGLNQAYERYNQLARWGETLLWEPGQVDTQPIDLSSLGQARETYDQLTSWVERGKTLTQTIAPITRELPVRTLEEVYFRWSWLDDLVARGRQLSDEIRGLERSEMRVIIDGHNLACRCATAPGLSELKDSQGRPTGAIVGFLNSMASWRLRFPEATFVVTWDGSSQRRRSAFPGYKASRGYPRATFEVEWLKAFLPLLGVEQAWNPEEEADDVIATLAAATTDSVLVISTDRDLLQLVSERVSVLSPLPKEKLYTPELVEKDYGVKPEQMTAFRALCGDTSDEIPGVTGCGDKTASTLVKMYGSLDGIFRSSLAGMRPAVYAAIRSSEAQVRRNQQLMTLIPTLAYTAIPVAMDRTGAIAALEEVQVKPQRLLTSFFQLSLL